MSHAASPFARRSLLALFLVGAVFAAARLLYHPIQLRIWNRAGPVDLLAMAMAMAPFVATRWTRGHRSKATGIAWWLCVAMALDVLAFAIGILAPTGGHPSLEAVASLFIGYAKLFTIPAALAALSLAALRGDRPFALLLGALCLVAQTVYTLSNPDQPLGWFAWLG